MHFKSNPFETRVLDFLERAKGFDVEAVRNHIATLCAEPIAVGAICVRAEGVKFQIDNRTVVTCTPGNGGMSNTKREKFIARAGKRREIAVA